MSLSWVHAASSTCSPPEWRVPYRHGNKVGWQLGIRPCKQEPTESKCQLKRDCMHDAAKRQEDPDSWLHRHIWKTTVVLHLHLSRARWVREHSNIGGGLRERSIERQNCYIKLRNVRDCYDARAWAIGRIYEELLNERDYLFSKSETSYVASTQIDPIIRISDLIATIIINSYYYRYLLLLSLRVLDYSLK